jgi:hypothetical protein
MNKYGRGDRRNISRNYVTSRTPTQVASHAQKYFIRLTTGPPQASAAALRRIPFEHRPTYTPTAGSPPPGYHPPYSVSGI